MEEVGRNGKICKDRQEWKKLVEMARYAKIDKNGRTLHEMGSEVMGRYVLDFCQCFNHGNTISLVTV